MHLGRRRLAGLGLGVLAEGGRHEAAERALEPWPPVGRDHVADVCDGLGAELRGRREAPAHNPPTRARPPPHAPRAPFARRLYVTHREIGLADRVRERLSGGATQDRAKKGGDHLAHLNSVHQSLAERLLARPQACHFGGSATPAGTGRQGTMERAHFLGLQAFLSIANWGSFNRAAGHRDEYLCPVRRWHRLLRGAAPLADRRRRPTRRSRSHRRPPGRAWPDAGRAVPPHLVHTDV